MIVQTDSAAERILSLTSPRILRDGFHKISVDQISSDLGISKKTFYKAFAGKEKLVEAIVNRVMHEVGAHLESIVDNSRDFTETFTRILTFLGSTGGRLGKPFLEDIERHMPDTWKRIERFRRERIQTIFSRLIDQGIRQGHVRATINRTLFLRSYIAAVEAVVTPSVLMHESFSAREAVQGILDMFFRGVLTPKAAQKLTRLKSQKHINHPVDIP